MKVLLLSMPDFFEHMPPVAVRMPNGALTSLAGNVDSHHKVGVADLILASRRVQETVAWLVREFDPELVGLSVMTFQRRTADRIIELVRTLKPSVKVTVGGYDPSLAGKPFTVKFSPQASGTANLAFVSNASISSIIEVVTGTGAPTIQHSVDPSWSPSTTAVIGYNIYRGSTSGGPYTKINSSLARFETLMVCKGVTVTGLSDTW